MWCQEGCGSRLSCEECNDDELRKVALRREQEKFVRCPNCRASHVRAVATCVTCSWLLRCLQLKDRRRPVAQR